MSKERKCIFCGTTYQYCPNCRDFSSYPKWMAEFDTEKCHDLYTVIGGYNIGINTIQDVKSTLDKYDVTDYSIFSKKLRDKLNELVPAKKEEQPKAQKDENKKENNFGSRKIKKNNKNNFERRVNNTEE